MSRRTVLVVGARGLIGRAAVERFEAAGDGDTDSGWEVIGLSRAAPDFATEADWIRCDLQDAEATRAALAAHPRAAQVTHLVYTALHEEARLAAGWFSPQHLDTNLAMLRNTLDCLEKAGASLEHATLLQGTKAYGVHVGEAAIPCKERSPRHPHANFYFAQEDELRARSQRLGFAMSILRPQIVCGVAIGAPMNVVATIGAFAAILREEGRPLFHPGSDAGCVEATSAPLLAEAIEWVATHERCAGETYNIANGDALVWRDVWPAVAAHFGMELAAPEPLGRLGDEMPKREGLWASLAEREGLRATSLAGLIGSSWQYADILWANSNPPGKPMLVSTIKARQHGFHACCDTEDMLVEQLAQMQREKLLPA